MKSLVAMCVILLIFYTGCQRSVEMEDIQGEWTSENAFLYLNVEGNSLSYWGIANPIHVPRKKTSGPMKYSDLSPSAFGRFDALIQMRPFVLGASGELIVQSRDERRDTLGVLAWDDSSLTIAKEQSYPIRLRPMRRDTSMRVDKIQFSTTACLGSCAVYDLELRSGSVVVVEPRGSWITGFPIARQTFSSPLPDSVWHECQAIVQKANVRESRKQYERGVVLEGDGQSFGVAIFHDDSVRTFLADGGSFPPDLAPLITYLGDPRSRFHLHPLDSAVLFRSRLCLMTSRNDTLTYLEGVNRQVYQAARFQGGEDSLDAYVRREIGPLAKRRDWSFACDIVIGRDGFVKEVIDKKYNRDASLFPVFERVLMNSPRWQAGLYDGRPVSVTEFYSFYNGGL